MNPVIVDSNVLLDVMTADPDWAQRSAAAMASLSANRQLAAAWVVGAQRWNTHRHLLSVLLLAKMNLRGELYLVYTVVLLFFVVHFRT